MTAIRAKHVRVVLEAARDTGLSRQSVVHLRNALSGVFESLFTDEVLAENPVRRCPMKIKNCKVDHRPRVILTDAEFRQFVQCSEVPDFLRLMALVSRNFGGMRDRRPARLGLGARRPGDLAHRPRLQAEDR